MRKFKNCIKNQVKKIAEAGSQEAELRACVERLFSDFNNKHYLTGEYLEVIRENFRDLSSAFGKSITHSLMVIAAFELLLRSALNSASLGPFEISDLSLVEKALPILGSYLYYDVGTIKSAVATLALYT